MKKLVCLLLAVLLLTACGAPAEETPTEGDNRCRLEVQGVEEMFEPWEQDGIPTEGSYYLTRDVMLTAPVTVSASLKLHLNGHRVTGEESVAFGSLITVSEGGELLLCDVPDGTGAVVSPRSYPANLTVTSLITVGGTVTVAGGTVDATAINLEDVADGAGFHVLSGGTLNIIGGTVIGGSTWCSAITPPAPEQPTEDTQPAEDTQPTEDTQPVEEELPFVIRGKGGSIYVAGGGTCNISDGTVRNGSGGLGGNVYVETEGVLNISGGLVTEGESIFHGGNIYVAEVGACNISGGEITLGGSYANGGNLMICGMLEMTGGVIAEGTCDVNSRGGKRGGNICVNGEESVVHIANATIRDGNASGGEGFGGNISVIGKCAREFSITDTTISGGVGHRGGNLYFGTLSKDVNPSNLDFYMSNVEVSGGTATYRGANLCMDSDLRGVYVRLVMDNSTILLDDVGRETIALGAGAAIDTWATLTMNGGSIEGGTLNLYQDAVLTANGTAMTMENNNGPGQLVINP